MYKVIIEGKIKEVREIASTFSLSLEKNSQGFDSYTGTVSSEKAIRESLKSVEYREWYQYGPEKIWVRIIPANNPIEKYAQLLGITSGKLEQLAFQFEGKELKPSMFSSQEKYNIFAQFMSEMSS